jgi:hypothetical protein
VGVLQSNLTPKARVVPGFEFVDNKGAAAKNAKRRENKKKKGASPVWTVERCGHGFCTDSYTWTKTQPRL